jgi:predicted DCC family thiol-disulfide oxidoreductase YuxK
MTKPILIYDGECEFCQYCVDYLAIVTHKNVQFCAYQENTHEIDHFKCKKAIQLIETDKTQFSAAAAGFKTLSYGTSNRGWWLYNHLPGFAWITEKIYIWITRHRGFCFGVAKLVCGNPWKPGRLTLVALILLSLFITVILLLKTA